MAKVKEGESLRAKKSPCACTCHAASVVRPLLTIPSVYDTLDTTSDAAYAEYVAAKMAGELD